MLQRTGQAPTDPGVESISQHRRYPGQCQAGIAQEQGQILVKRYIDIYIEVKGALLKVDVYKDQRHKNKEGKQTQLVPPYLRVCCCGMGRNIYVWE